MRMMRLIIIDDADCKEKLNGFLSQNDKNIRLNVELDNIGDKVDRFLGNINNIYLTDKKLAINTSGSLLLVNVRDIIRCESKRNYTVIYFSNKKELLVAKTLREFEELLGTYHFFRVHRSHLINVNYIDKYVKNKGNISLHDGTQIHVSQKKRELFFKLLGKL